MSAGPGVAPANCANCRFILARAAVRTLIWSCFGGRPLAEAGAAAAVVLVPAMTAPVIRARRGCPAGPAAPAWADGSMNAAISAAAVTGSVRLTGALRMYLLLRASLGVGGPGAAAPLVVPRPGPRSRSATGRIA